MLKKITILTLFKNSFDSYFNESIIKRAIQKKLIEIEIIDFRQFSNNKHHKVDDYPYGGGPGMVISIQPIVDCLKTIKTNNSYTILLTPSGALYKQQIANKLVKSYDHIIFICGHYEGIDERIYNYIDNAISIGDYILTSGEVACMVMVDNLVRLIDGAINKDSLNSESFNNYLFDYPVYTKPHTYDNYTVPDVLLSGNHELIAKYRENQRIEKTKKIRIDLYEKYINLKKGK